MKSALLIFFTLLLCHISFPQNITSINPNEGDAGTTLNVTITGTNTHFTQATSTNVGFFFSGASGTATFPHSINTINSQTLMANLSIPTGISSGWYDFAVWTDLDGFMLKPNGFKVNGSAIHSITPNEGKAGATLNVSITGTNTHFTQATSTVVRFYFSGATSTATYPNSLQNVNNLNLNANLTIPASTPQGWYNFSVTNDIDGYLFKPSSFKVNNDIGITEPSISDKFFVFPNPFTDHLTLNISNSQQEEAVLSIYNTSGLLVDERTLRLLPGTNEIPLRLHLPYGVYYLIVNRSNGRSHATKIIRNQ